jgi:ABC-2 type transport system ATP-binding protein
VKLDAGMRRPTLDDVFLRLTGHAATEDDAAADGARGGGGSAVRAEQQETVR